MIEPLPMRRPAPPWPLAWAAIPVLLIACDAETVASAATKSAIRIMVAGQPDRHAKTLDDALAQARAARRFGPRGPITILLPAGITRLAQPIALTSADSGTPDAPLVIRGQADGSSTVSGAVTVATAPGSGEATVDLARVAPSLRPDLSVTSTEAGDPAARLLLFQDRLQLMPASWPATGYYSAWNVTASGTRLTASGARLPRGRLVAAGYLSQDWQYETVPARSDGSAITLDRAAGAAPLQKTVRLKLLNTPGPLAPGHYAIKGATVRLKGFEADRPVEVAIARSLIAIDGAHNIRIERLALEKANGTAVTVTNATNIAFADCFVGLTGGYGIDVANGRNVDVDRCVIAHTGGGGVRLNGGDRTVLQPGGNDIRHSLIVDFGQLIRTYAPGVALTGVKNTVSQSFIGDGPHAGIVIAGNDHRVEGNELGFLACETNDASAIYMGRDWTQRGNRLTRNFIHDVGRNSPETIVSGIYLDDQFSGTQIDHNVMLRIPHGVFVGGGRDNRIDDNLFAAMARSAIWLDDRGVSWQRDAAAAGGLLRQSLEASPYRTPLWRARYPALARLPAERPGQPVGNSATNNRSIGAQFLWVSPMTLRLAGDGNQEVPVSVAQQAALRSSSIAAQYAAIGGPAVAGTPGLRIDLLFARYAARPTRCATS